MSIFDGSDSLADFPCEQAIGRNIVCEDGVQRRVVEIVTSYAFPWRSIINEGDPDSKSGYFVNNLSLAAQLLGKPVPTKEMQEAFARTTQALNYNEPRNRQERLAMMRTLQMRKKRKLFLR